MKHRHGHLGRTDLEYVAGLHVEADIVQCGELPEELPHVLDADDGGFVTFCRGHSR